jgi:hypothetical protein
MSKSGFSFSKSVEGGVGKLVAACSACICTARVIKRNPNKFDSCEGKATC